MSNLWNREPVMVMTVVWALLGLLLAFGVDLTKEQVGAITTFVAAVLGLVVRRKVSPTVE